MQRWYKTLPTRERLASCEVLRTQCFFFGGGVGGGFLFSLVCFHTSVGYVIFDRDEISVAQYAVSVDVVGVTNRGYLQHGRDEGIFVVGSFLRRAYTYTPQSLLALPLRVFFFLNGGVFFFFFFISTTSVCQRHRTMRFYRSTYHVRDVLRDEYHCLRNEEPLFSK